jgi:hypothetical protein
LEDDRAKVVARHMPDARVVALQRVHRCRLSTSRGLLRVGDCARLVGRFVLGVFINGTGPPPMAAGNHRSAAPFRHCRFDDGLKLRSRR